MAEKKPLCGPRIAKLIECAICLKIYSDPRQLPCLHSFCAACIMQHGDDKNAGDDLECPLCRNSSPVPQEGLGSLQKNFFLQELIEIHSVSDAAIQKHCQICSEEKRAVATLYCTDCKQEMCENCCKFHQKMPLCKDHEVIALGEQVVLEEIFKSKAKYCTKHPNKSVEFFCKDCDTVLCVTCFVVDAHKSHTCCEISEVAEQHRRTLTTDILVVSDLVKRSQHRKDIFGSNRQRFLETVSKSQTAIQEYADKLKEAIDLKVQTLQQEVSEFKASKIKQIDTAEDEINKHFAMMESFVNYSQELLERGCPCDVVLYYKENCHRAEQLRAVKLDKEVGDISCVDICFVPSKILSSDVNFVGYLKTTELPVGQPEDKRDDERQDSEKIRHVMGPQDGESLPRTEFDVEEHVWLYIQYKHSGIVQDFARKYECGLHYSRRETKYILVLSAFNASKLEEAVEELSGIYRLMDDFIIVFHTDLPGTCDPSSIKALLEGTDCLLLDGEYHRIVGPKEAVEEVKKKLGKRVKNEPTLQPVEDIFSFCMTSGLRVHIRQGNIIHQQVEAIVNAANVRLQHGSGVARSIADAAGSRLKDECRDYIKSYGELMTSRPIHTSAGNIPPPVKYVIHVAGPIARDYTDKEVMFGTLRRTFLNVIQYANDALSVSSVAIPAISSGIYGIDKRIAAQCSYEALLRFEEMRLLNPSSNQILMDVYFVNIDEETTKIMEKVFRSLSDKVDDIGSKHTNLLEKNNEVQRPGFIETPPSSGVLASGATKNDVDSNDKRNIVPSRAEKRQLKKDDCVICMDAMVDPKQLDCGHSFCTTCIDQYFAMGQPKCPSCGQLFGVLRGNQPPGTYYVKVSKFRLDGYTDCGTIEITYSIPDGIQTAEHPHPDKPFTGAQRTGYLPDNAEGREVLELLIRAFDARLIFTVGRSVTSGKEDMVVWNDIHHKTRPTGAHGYPDSTYLKRVKEELAAKGIFPK